MNLLVGPAPAPAGTVRDAETARSMLRESDLLVEVLARCAGLGLPGWYLAAGCVAQTVWNHRTGRPLDQGIRDHDLIYFDDADLGWAAENEAIRAARAAVRDLPVELEVRNQARVHLWYEARFGIPCPRYLSAEMAIGTFPSTASSVGVRLEPDGAWRLYAPFGLTDLLGLILRPNLVLAPAGVFARKARRWRERWPELRLCAPEPEDGDGRPAGNGPYPSGPGR
ncbi:nucleotidyltransferase family protein [Actinoallomurus rhizosphaericola]|uniref:nucleotidyltransferase family protein n=1 Tax=Actinoallomurus rhizosphaericola TaxID=2952536 RepID=UPI00209249DB|nr:nucleotidyltransferase family protein [Actinoallomurus rhizosphaericola]MCO5996742.1 nucleotidyltransferase family protein [Actinoallomurus rhizosphaericola]